MKRIHSYVVSAVFAVAASLTVGSSVHAQTLEQRVARLEATVAMLESQLDAVQANHALALGPFVSVDPNPESGVVGPNIIFSGANIHIVSGSGSTDDNGEVTGLGNLIIGYNEDPGKFRVPPPFTLTPLRPGDRGGSHNLVIGRWNRFTEAAFGGIVTGEFNNISAEAASITGGRNNDAVQSWASVSGGRFNTANGESSSVSGGGGNLAKGEISSVSGGVGGRSLGFGASVTGGFGNAASGFDASVIGGNGNTASNAFSIRPEPPFP